MGRLAESLNAMHALPVSTLSKPPTLCLFCLQQVSCVLEVP